MLFSKISEDLTSARKKGETTIRDILSFVLSELQALAKSKKLESLTDEEVISALKKQVAQRNNIIDQIKQGHEESQTSAIEKLKLEIETIKSYLPEEPSLEQSESIIKEVIKELGASSMKDIGNVMKAVTQKAPGIDKSLVPKVLKELTQ